MSTPTKTAASKATFLFNTEAEAQGAADLINTTVKGSAADSAGNSLLVVANSKSSMYTVTDLLLNLGGQIHQN